jgi:hypothetical protein
MKTISFREEFFPSLPHSEPGYFVNGAKVSRVEFLAIRGNACRSGQVVSEETHSSGGKTVHHVLAKLDPT